MELPIKGGCWCGDVRYVVDKKPYGQANCHCRACQHATGGAYAAVVLVPTTGFVVSGAYCEHASQGDSGHQVNRAFCGNCGTTVFARTTRVPGMRPVYAATLDKPEEFSPTLDAWTDFAQPWVHMDPQLPKFRRDLPAECAGLPAPARRGP